MNERRFTITQPIPVLARQPQAMPAEWSPHDATWLAWPHAVADWPGKFAPIPWVFAEIVRWLVPGEVVRLLVNDAEHERRARKVLARSGVDTTNVEFRRVATDRSWLRDSGPIFVRRGSEKAIARFRFNAWARYADWKRDAKVPERAAKALGVPLLPVLHRDVDVVLEGGAIDVNGQGTLLATEECLLDPEVQVRNPGFSREDYEAVFRDALGASNAIWLGNGLAGDDTHGHVDDVARFVNARTVVLCQELNGGDPNHRSLEANRERLEGARLQDGSRPDLVRLPMPAPVLFDGRRLPASYANFYVGNAAVLVPTFGDMNDRLALGILNEIFRGCPVIGIPARDLVWGLGAIHCLTQQEPAVGPPADAAAPR